MLSTESSRKGSVQGGGAATLGATPEGTTASWCATGLRRATRLGRWGARATFGDRSRGAEYDSGGRG